MGDAVDLIGELTSHYAQAVAKQPPRPMCAGVLEVRSFTAVLLDRAGRSPYHRDLAAAAGWLSNLLAIATNYLGDPAAALVWCADAERRSREARQPELAGWAAVTRALIAYYQSDPVRSATLAARGQQLVSTGSAVYTRLAAQRMRAHAMQGDQDAMSEARAEACASLSQLPATVPTTGVFGVVAAAEPPYTATSLLLVGRFDQAAVLAQQLLDSVYRTRPGDPRPQPSNYARTLLILAMAQAGNGDIDAAAVTGARALDAAPPVWPTLMLADRLGHVLTGHDPHATATGQYREHYRRVSRSAAVTSLPVGT